MTQIVAYIVTGLVTAVFLLALGWAFVRGMRQMTGRLEYQPAIQGPDKRDYRTIVLWVMASGLFIYAVGLIAFALRHGMPDSLGSWFYQAFVKADAYHYLEVAQNGYKAVGETRYFVVFFPLFPWLVRLLAFVLRDYVLAAVLLNNALLCVGCIFMYKLGCMDYDRSAALRSVRYLLLFPMAFFFRNPYTESLFFTLSAISLYMCRQKRYAFAGIFGALCALTRMTGLLLLGTIIIEALLDAGRAKRECGKGAWRVFWRNAWPALIVPIGTLIYLLMNLAVTGDAFMFLTHQREHWSNWFRPFPHALYTSLFRMITNTNVHQAAFWISQTIAFCLLVWLIWMSVKRLRIVQTAYNLAYYGIMMSSNWLLSGPRYLMGMFPVQYTVALLTKNKSADIICTCLSVAGLMVMTGLFAIGYAIY